MLCLTILGSTRSYVVTTLNDLLSYLISLPQNRVETLNGSQSEFEITCLLY